MVQRQPNGHILLIDDDTLVRLILRARLETRGFCVETARTLAEAVSLLSEKRFDLVVVDLRLTGVRELSTLDFIQALRIERPEIAIFVLTSFCSSAVEEAARAIGVNYFLSKPQLVDRIVGVVDGHFGRPALEQS